MTKAFQEAIETGRAILGDLWKGKFATYDRQFGLTELMCPLCGVLIAKLLPVGSQNIRRVKGQTIIQEGVALARLASYREVLLDMNDGSRHVVNVCAECAGHMHDPMVSVARYAADLAQWSSEGSTLTDDTCNRSPVAVLKVADYIREND